MDSWRTLLLYFFESLFSSSKDQSVLVLLNFMLICELLIIFCQVLNAKPENVEREAEIVAQSGRSGAVTIATNMAGRGTDIILGGNSEFMARLKLREMLMPR